MLGSTLIVASPPCDSSYIDSGRNPELFTRHQLEQTLSDYEAVQRKVQAYKVCRNCAQDPNPKLFSFTTIACLQEFRAELIQQLQKPFEVEIAAYLASCREK